MLRLLSSNFSFVNGINFPNVNLVRWRRKPRWLPVAKSKQFRIPERKKQSPDEYKELLRLNNIYRTQLRSVRSYLSEEVKTKSKISTPSNLVTSPMEEKLRFEKCMEINDEWNAKIASERDERLRKSIEQRKLTIIRNVEMLKQQQEEEQMKIEEIVKLQKERMKNIIKEERLDETIERILANPKDYNFAIDLDGKIHGTEEVQKS